MIISIDIGGTNFRIGTVTKENRLVRFDKVTTASVLTSGDVLADLAHFLKEYANGLSIEAIAIGFPATLDKQRKTVLQAPNLKYMENLPVVDTLERKLGIPVFAERDVTFALRYDVWKYHVAQDGIVCGFYFGTGIGNALLLNGIPFTGKNGTAGELGHIPVVGDTTPCGCGNIGCMECLAGGKHLAMLQRTLWTDTPIGELFVRHSDSDEFKSFVDRMAITIATEINILDPDAVLIGGGVPNMPGFPREYLRTRVLAHTRKPLPYETLNMIETEDEPEKSVIGGAMYARDKLKR